MSTIELKYGRTSIPFDYDKSKFEVLGSDIDPAPLSDADLGAALDDPLDSPRLEEIVNPGEPVLFVVPDATRQIGAGQVVSLVVRRLIANGSAPNDISIIFATGIHRPVTGAERQIILTPFVAQRIRTLDHNADDPIRNFRLGETSGGIPVELNWILTEFDHVVLVGGVTFHYFAGFTGGRKLICPGLASAKTIEATHKLAFDCERKRRREGVGTGRLEGNSVHEACTEAAAMINPSFAINTIVGDTGEIVDLICGNWITSHRKACEVYTAAHPINVTEKRHLVIVSCGGYPFDINMIQAHKALEAASQCCTDGGMIILLAECADGLGRSDFLNWFESENSDALGEKLCQNYQVNGQTAWSLLKKAERFDVRILTGIDEEIVNKMRMKKLKDPDEITVVLDRERGYLLIAGAKFFFEGGS